MSAVLTSIGQLQRRGPVLQIVAVVVLFLYGSTTIDGFGAEQSIRSMLVIAALLGLAAAGQTLCVLIGSLDLSVPGLILLGAVLISELYGAHGWPFLAALAFVIVVCGAAGAAVGFICHRFQVPSLIITLAVSFLALGATQVWTDGQVTGAPPTELTDFVAANGTTFGLSVSPIVVLWAVFAIVVGIILQKTVAGRHIFASGANPRAAELSLVSTRRVWVTIFMVSAILSGLVGVLLAGFSGADSSIGDPYLFQGLAAVIVGGTVFMGARGDYTHTVVGALILTELTTILIGRGYELAEQQIIFGLLILVVVAAYGRDRRLRDRI